MAELDKDSAATHAVDLLKHYGFDLGKHNAEELVHYWSRDYPISWLRSAVIEALYQGRYKAVSVEQILTLWRRRGQPIHHFNHEFERIICSQFPTYRGILTTLADTTTTRATSSPAPRSLKSSRTETATNAASPESPNLESGSTPTSANAVPADNLSAEAVSTEVVFAESLPEKATVEPDNNPLSSNAESPSIPLGRSFAPVPSAPLSEQPPEPQTSESDSQERLPIVESMLEVRQGELPIQTFKPQGRSELVTTEWCTTNWPKTSAAKQPIHQFIPTEESPDFYSKLKAVAQGHDSTNPHINLATLNRQPPSPNEP